MCDTSGCSALASTPHHLRLVAAKSLAPTLPQQKNHHLVGCRSKAQIVHTPCVQRAVSCETSTVERMSWLCGSLFEMESPHVQTRDVLSVVQSAALPEVNGLASVNRRGSLLGEVCRLAVVLAAKKRKYTPIKKNNPCGQVAISSS